MSRSEQPEVPQGTFGRHETLAYTVSVRAATQRADTTLLFPIQFFACFNINEMGVGIRPPLMCHSEPKSLPAPPFSFRVRRRPLQSDNVPLLLLLLLLLLANLRCKKEWIFREQLIARAAQKGGVIKGRTPPFSAAGAVSEEKGSRCSGLK